MKRRTLPVVLNAVIPGTGLWYLGYRVPALVNFLLAVLIPIVGGFWFSEHVHWLFLGVAAGSAGVAHAFAGRASGNAASSQSAHP